MVKWLTSSHQFFFYHYDGKHNGQKTNCVGVCSFSCQPPTPTRSSQVKSNWILQQVWRGLILCWDPASFRNGEGEATYEAMTPDLTAVTESTDTNGHLCEGLSGNHTWLSGCRLHQPNVTCRKPLQWLTYERLCCCGNLLDIYRSNQFCFVRVLVNKVVSSA